MRWLLLFLLGCGVEKPISSESDTDTDADADADSDTDTDTDNAPLASPPVLLADFPGFLMQYADHGPTLDAALVALTPLVEAEVDSTGAQDGWILPPLLESQTTGITKPAGVDLEATVNVAVAARVRHTLDDYASVLLEVDQTFASSNYTMADRTVSSELGSFATGAGSFSFSDDVESSSFGVTTPFTLEGDYWRTPTAIMGRRAVPHSSCGGSNCIEQSYSIDVFLETSTGVRRFAAAWSETTSPLAIPDDVIRAAVANGWQGQFHRTDTHLD